MSPHLIARLLAGDRAVPTLTSGVVMSTEPAVIVGAATSVVTAVLALLVAFAVPVTEAQQAAILAVVAAIAPLVVAVVTRGYVSPAGQGDR